MSKITEDFIRSLVDRFPNLGPLLAEHLRDNFGQLLPHIFMGDTAGWAVSLMKGVEVEPDILPQQELSNLVEYLEDTWSTGNDELQELIAVSFLENLPYPGQDGSAIRSKLGPVLTEQLRVIG